MSSLTAKSMLECIIGEEPAKYVNFFRSDADKKEVLVKFRVNQDEVYSETFNVKSEEFKQWLFLYYIGDKDSKFNNAYKRLISAIPFDRTLQTVNVFKRVGFYQNNIYIDLCNKDCKVVKISNNSDGSAWTIIDENEVSTNTRHERTSGT